MRVEVPSIESSPRIGVWIFLRGMALVYFAAFASLIPQIAGLVGPQGILPAGEYLSLLAGSLGTGLNTFLAAPSLFWIGAGNGALLAALGVGTGLSLLLFLDIAPGPCLALLWALYLSVVSVGQDFFNFQWDSLLLETGLLSLFLAPWRLVPRLFTLPELPSRFPLLLLRWLLFRFLLLNGLAKFAGPDPAWHAPAFDAVSWHWATQPLPSPLAWHLAHAPMWVNYLAFTLVIVVELVLPCFIFGGNRLRRIAFCGIALLQLLLILTGNFAFLNGLTLTLAALLLDDRCFLPLSGLFPGFREGNLLRPVRLVAPSEGRRLVTYAVGGFLLFWSVVVTLGQISGVEISTVPVLRVADTWLTPWRVANNYGLFSVMTKSRTEIEIEGSLDGTHWRPYRFRYKPDLTDRAKPGWIAPFQPRLDWQMWFAALSTGDRTPWFSNLLARLLQGSPDVVHLFSSSPYGTTPPRYIRALSYDYRFTTPAERKALHGAIWKKSSPASYFPATTLNAPPSGSP
ncbi:Lipase maturation factor [Verrucomicrobium sp. GAS474]|uniref:lipase maturation factor family protein n=1 Tax=Verrucomicrobium sp. GAS474 TaxID=1882831 RepID=UPI000879560D|nr:lipase maturation factor family protein [Verrucomicrobium sp. GAS474]SDU07845.1 Lipase maturation factor [Verrucomicrobium sp. GAS474]